MVSETLTLSRMLAAGIAWPPDDTAESVGDTDLHQKTITNVRLGVNECAEIERSAEEPVPWQPEGDRRWRSEEIGISISLEGAMATVHDAKGRRQLREGEIARELARKDTELAELRRLLDEARGK